MTLTRSAALLCLLLAAGGCETERVAFSEGSRPMPPEPRRAPATPADAPANEMAFLVGQKPQDTNGNGYPDTIQATVILFASPHPTSVMREGDFHFDLYARGASADPKARPIAQWHYDREAAMGLVAAAQYGPRYQFRLSLQEARRSDVLPLTRADLLCRFEAADGGAPVRSSGVRSLQLGKR
ncbi:MAG: hypothetical protein ACYTGR_19970 [Planctomycetota bacterium]|jgi:hypothetical protein